MNGLTYVDADYRSRISFSSRRSGLTRRKRVFRRARKVSGPAIPPQTL